MRCSDVCWCLMSELISINQPPLRHKVPVLDSGPGWVRVRGMYASYVHQNSEKSDISSSNTGVLILVCTFFVQFVKYWL